VGKLFQEIRVLRAGIEHSGPGAAVCMGVNGYEDGGHVANVIKDSRSSSRKR